jgi:hypothetical protein
MISSLRSSLLSSHIWIEQTEMEETMNGKLARHDLRFGTFLFILLTLSLGCLCLPAGITPASPSPTPPVNPVITATPVLETPINPIVTATPTLKPPDNTAGLSSNVPWLLIETDRGLWAANTDGSGLTQLTDVDYWDWNLPMAIQPGGNQVVFLSPSTYDFHNMALNLLSLPDGTITKLTDLTSPATEAYTESVPGDDKFEALRAVRDRHNYSWSPDGTRLAFVGLMDGPSAEIYLYDATSGEIKRVSTDDAQNYWPSWSPDGNTLLYFGAKAFGTGAGLDTTGVWSARGDGTNVTWLYVPKDGSEDLVGWLDAKTAVLDTWHPASGGENLRLFDTVTTKMSMLSEDWIISAEADSLHGGVMFANRSGLYLLTAEDRTLVQVSQEEVVQIDPLEPGEYFFSVHFADGSLATYGTSEYDHQVSPVKADSGSLEVAMFAWIWGWTSEGNSQPGVWITGPRFEFGHIFDGDARLPIWDKHKNLLFFAPYGGSGYDLYRTTFDATYRDLTVVGSIDAEIYRVVWFGESNSSVGYHAKAASPIPVFSLSPP